MAKKMEAARKRGGSPTAWGDSVGDRNSGPEAPVSTAGGPVMLECQLPALTGLNQSRAQNNDSSK